MTTTDTSEDTRVRVVLVDDSKQVRTVLRLALEADGRFEVVAEGHNGKEGAELSALHQPDIVVTDYLMPDMDGVTSIPLIRKGAPDAKILVYSSQGIVDNEPAATAAGADAYFEKYARPSDVVVAITSLAGLDD